MNVPAGLVAPFSDGIVGSMRGSSQKVRDGERQGRADATLVRGIWLEKTTESDEHRFATDTGVYNDVLIW